MRFVRQPEIIAAKKLAQRVADGNAGVKECLRHRILLTKDKTYRAIASRVRKGNET